MRGPERRRRGLPHQAGGPCRTVAAGAQPAAPEGLRRLSEEPRRDPGAAGRRAHQRHPAPEPRLRRAERHQQPDRARSRARRTVQGGVPHRGRGRRTARRVDRHRRPEHEGHRPARFGRHGTGVSRCHGGARDRGEKGGRIRRCPYRGLAADRRGQGGRRALPALGGGRVLRRKGNETAERTGGRHRVCHRPHREAGAARLPRLLRRAHRSRQPQPVSRARGAVHAQRRRAAGTSSPCS